MASLQVTQRGAKGCPTKSGSPPIWSAEDRRELVRARPDLDELELGRVLVEEVVVAEAPGVAVAAADERQEAPQHA
jgi:hypothetical protein